MPTFGTASNVAGVLSLVLLTAVVVLGVLVNRHGRLPGLTRYAGVSLHRNLSLLAVVFLAVHALLAGVGLVAVFVPLSGLRGSWWLSLGAVALDLLAAITVTSLVRVRIGLRAWRAVHWFSYVCWPLALVHSVATGTGLRGGRLLDLAGACVAVFLAAVAWRLAGTWRARRGE
jgi:predicted ferric reductase